MTSRVAPPNAKGNYWLAFNNWADDHGLGEATEDWEHDWDCWRTAIQTERDRLTDRLEVLEVTIQELKHSL